MTKTLYCYLSRDLVKVTLMALVVLTMILTILGAIEPMRKYGLTGRQILNLFGFLVPMVLPLTLPVSALFGATFVYGRFGQTNEYLAAKASGISGSTLLRPAVILGVLVTASSLVVSNYVAPAMSERLGHAVEENLSGLAYQSLRTRGYVQLPQARFLHADEVDRDCREIHGIVVAELKPDGVVGLAVIPSARVREETVGGKRSIRFDVSEAAMTWSDRYDIAWMEEPSLDPIEPPTMAKEKASWYDWDRLHTTLKNPSLNSKIRHWLLLIHQNVCADMTAGRLSAAINATQRCSFGDGVDKYVLIARGAESGDMGSVKLFQGDQRVRLTVRRGGRIVGIIDADDGVVSIAEAPPGGAARARIVLSGQVRGRSGQGHAGVLRGGPWRREGLSMARDTDALKHVADAVIRGGGYTFSDGTNQYDLTAGWADLDDSGLLALSPIRPVTVIVTGRADKIVTANSGTLVTAWNSRTERMATAITLGGGPVTVRTTRWRRDGLIVPENFASAEDFAKDIANTVNPHLDYDLHDAKATYTLSAGRAEVTANRTVRLSTAVRNDGRKRVEIRIREVPGLGNRVVRTMTADAGEVAIHWSPQAEQRTAVVVLSGNVDLGRHKEWKPPRGMAVPEEIVLMLESPNLAGLCRDIEKSNSADEAPQTSDNMLRNATRLEIGYLTWEIMAEMHGRIALGLSCCLLVTLGAALGLMFRGGQVLSAFAISVAPALVAYIMVFMGKQMVTNPKVDPFMGLAAVWSGDILLVLGNVYIYVWAIRRR